MDKGYYFPDCEFIFRKQKHQNDKKVLRRGHDFSTILPFAGKKIREKCYSMANDKYVTTKVMINKLQSLKGKIKIKIHQKFK